MKDTFAAEVKILLKDNNYPEIALLSLKQVLCGRESRSQSTQSTAKCKSRCGISKAATMVRSPSTVRNYYEPYSKKPDYFDPYLQYGGKSILTSNAKAIDPRVKKRSSISREELYSCNRILNAKMNGQVYLKEKFALPSNNKITEVYDSVLFRMPSPDKIH